MFTSSSAYDIIQVYQIIKELYQINRLISIQKELRQRNTKKVYIKAKPESDRNHTEKQDKENSS